MPKAITRKKVRSIDKQFEREQEAVSQAQLRSLSDIRSAFFAGVDPRRRREMADGGMVQEDPNAMANLSPRFIHKEYPQGGTGFTFTPYLSDSDLD